MYGAGTVSYVGNRAVFSADTNLPMDVLVGSGSNVTVSAEVNGAEIDSENSGASSVPTCNAKLTGNADVDLAARYIFAESTSDYAEMVAIGIVGANRYEANQARFGGQDWAKVWFRLSIAEDHGGSNAYNRADPQNLPKFSQAECNKYNDATRAARQAVSARSNPGNAMSFLLSRVYWFLGAGAQTQGLRIGGTTFYTRDPNPKNQPKKNK